MCMQCVAQSTPMVGVGLTVLRRKSLAAFVKASFGARSPSCAVDYSIRKPLMVRAMTSCWICSVPSKMS